MRASIAEFMAFPYMLPLLSTTKTIRRGKAGKEAFWRSGGARNKQKLPLHAQTHRAQNEKSVDHTRRCCPHHTHNQTSVPVSISILLDQHVGHDSRGGNCVAQREVTVRLGSPGVCGKHSTLVAFPILYHKSMRGARVPAVVRSRVEHHIEAQLVRERNTISVRVV